MKTDRMKKLKTGLEEYIKWLNKFKKRNPSDYFNDGYDEKKVETKRILSVLNWLDGTVDTYNNIDFSNCKEVYGIFCIKSLDPEDWGIDGSIY